MIQRVLFQSLLARGSRALGQGIFNHLMNAPWFQRFVRNTQNAAGNSVEWSQRATRYIELAKEEIKRDFTKK